MREELWNCCIDTEAPGITPAHAGRINRFAHGLLHGPGSPPRMREECWKYALRYCVMGITPAHAGRMDKDLKGYEFFTDHPRACGKNSCSGRNDGSTEGSPPRMREECLIRRWLSSTPRITPAHAGRISYPSYL